MKIFKAGVFAVATQVFVTYFIVVLQRLYDFTCDDAPGLFLLYRLCLSLHTTQKWPQPSLGMGKCLSLPR